jgi:glucans biosynthesis protein C
MMLLGLVLHAAASYVTVPLGLAWPFQDHSTGVPFDLLVFVIHIFRMPVFFVVAGFFAALLYQREGPRGFLVHRARRILLPLAAAWVVIGPAVLMGFRYANGQGREAGGLGLAELPGAMARNGLLHLWFLYYLFIFCLLAVAAGPFLRRLSAAPALFGAVLRRRFGVVVPIMLTALSLLPMRSGTLDTATDFLPVPRVLVAYGVFFAFGWLLYLRRELVPALAPRTWPCLVGGVLTAGGWLVWRESPRPDLPARLVGHVLMAAAIWLFVVGLMALFVRHLDRPRPLQRYLADGAYWIYLVHLPFTIWLPGLLAPLGWPAAAKFAVALAGTALVTVGSYHLFVRSTWIGAALNGRRFLRGLPPP